MKEWWRIRFPCKLQAMARPRDGSSLLHSNFVQLFFCGNKDIFIHEQMSGLQDLSGTDSLFGSWELEGGNGSLWYGDF
jgi:hypothetical protein